MQPATLGRAQSRLLDKRAMEEYGVSGLVLMENAGRGVVDVWSQQVAADENAPALGHQKVVLCCGKGNNAGDGFVVARHLDLRGIDCRVLMWSKADELMGDAAVNFHILEKCGVPIIPINALFDVSSLDSLLAEATWIIDALLGTGAQGEPRPPFDLAIERINEAKAPVLAVDLPSGLDCDTGKPSRHTIEASHTCTFVAAKPGLLAPQASKYVGQLHVVDIGAPRKLIEEMLG